MNNLTNSTHKSGQLLLLLLVAFLLKYAPAQAQVATITDDAVTLTVQPTGLPPQTNQNYAGSQNNSPYDTYDALGQSDNSTSMPPPQLGTYDLDGHSMLNITTAAIQGTIGSSNTTVNSTVLQYQVYPVGTASASKPGYTTINLTPTQASGAFSGSLSATTINLLNGLTSGGTYVLDVRFAVMVTRTLSNGTMPTRTVYDLSGGSYFYATFYVTPPPTTPPGGVTTWQSTDTGPNGTRWFVAANWSNGIPNAASDVVIPENTQGSNIVFPILNSRTVNYAVRNITLQGTTNSGRAQVTIQTAVLHVYGNISQLSGGLVGTVTDKPGVADSTANSTIVLAGASQFITGRLSVPDVIVAGSGVKSVANTLLPTNTISLRPKVILDGVVVQTASPQTTSTGTTTYVFDTTGNSVVNLGGTGIINTLDGSNETITSYIKGVVLANGPLVAGTTQRFGNTGLEFTPNHPATLVSIQRIIGDPLIGPTSSSNSRAVPIKRQYNINGDDNSASTNTTGSTNTVIFHYLPSAFELNGIDEDNLTMYSSTTGSAPFVPLNGTLDKTARTVTQPDVATFTNYFLTLGDKTNPLPVTLISFLATRNGANAQLTWATASEKNNQGFEVQVSTDGTSFRKLAFVASQASNSTTKLDYAYTDVEAGKTGARYYRLRQLDLDGTSSYSPVRVVGFDGSAVATELSIYPNPVASDGARLFIQTAEVGTAHLRITDLMGRVLSDQAVTTASGSNEVALPVLATAKQGTYVAQFTLPSGQIKTLKVQKQ